MTPSRLLLIALTLWGLAMIVPDLLRVAQPLGSFGLIANNDGVVYGVVAPFSDEKSSPAWKAGIRPGDRLDLSRLHCRISDLRACGDALATLGGVQYVLPGQAATLYLAAKKERPARQVTTSPSSRRRTSLSVPYSCSIRLPGSW
jgi:hypothetical protein